MKVKDLKRECAELGLKVTGSKDVLKARLIDKLKELRLYPGEPLENLVLDKKKSKAVIFQTLLKKKKDIKYNNDIKMIYSDYTDASHNRGDTYWGDNEYPTDRRLKRVGRKITLVPNYFALIKKYQNNTCIVTGKKHQLCRNYNVRTKRLRRNPGEATRWLETEMHLYARPSNTEVDHILPLCLGGPDCSCNFQLLTKNEHDYKTKKFDIAACRHFKVRI